MSKDDDHKIAQLGEELKRRGMLPKIDPALKAPDGSAFRLPRVYIPGQELRPHEQNVRDFVLKNRRDPALREKAAELAAWLTQELGSPLWDPEFRPAPAPDKLPPKQVIIRAIIRKLYPPDGKVPLELRTAEVVRQVAREWTATCQSEDWRSFCKQHGIRSRQPPDRHTVARAIDREV